MVCLLFSLFIFFWFSHVLIRLFLIPRFIQKLLRLVLVTRARFTCAIEQQESFFQGCDISQCNSLAKVNTGLIVISHRSIARILLVVRTSRLFGIFLRIIYNLSCTLRCFFPSILCRLIWSLGSCCSCSLRSVTETGIPTNSTRRICLIYKEVAFT